MCWSPYELKEKHPHTGETQTVPCGKCVPCKKRIISSWSFRLVQHGKQWPTCHFVTLTYDNAHVPFSPARYMTLNKKHVQDFMKRLRKRQSQPCSYFFVGEYGSKYMRPHYHALIYNADPADIVAAWRVPVLNHAGKKLYLDGELVTKPIGNVFFGTVSEASIGYCLKYIMKDAKVPMHRNDDRVPEFRLMSRGLGLNYITLETIEWHRADINNRMYVPVGNGKKAAMPRYYKDWIYPDDADRALIACATVRDSLVRQSKALSQLQKKYGDNATSILIQSQAAAERKLTSDAKKRQDL